MRFTLAHVLGWSAFLAVPLCILQALMQDASGPIGWGPLLICFWGASLCLFLLWFLYVALAAKFALWKSLAATSLLIVGTVGVELVVKLLAEGPARLEEVLMLAANFSAGALVFVCLKLAYRYGFRLLPFEARRQPGID